MWLTRALGVPLVTAQSDLDFLVEFRSLESGKHADTCLGLLAELETLFDRPVDLVMASAVDNPYYLQDIHRSEIELYAA